MLTLLPAFQDNYIYLLESPTGLWIVDPGDAEPVENFLQAQQCTPTAILCTHHHRDHVGGVRRLAERYGVPVYGKGPLIPAQTVAVHAGPLELDGESLQVLEIPGHTLDHVGYLWKNYLFCGDTLFGAGCGRIFEGTPALLYASLQQLAALPDDTQICCAHEYTLANLHFAATIEPHNAAIRHRLEHCTHLRQQGLPTLPSTLAEERASNPFLRCGEPSVIAKARSLGAQGEDTLSVFTCLRSWKDRYQDDSHPYRFTTSSN
ncbi:MAG: hydroxyacylglutathione hydrolase [Acidithiobacillus sp.]|nr:hydroxyacylglutathione hydrolase [Acidithiobacillus sp.]